jgi:molybdopterin-guanine dinucleotide biosynthesis protein A
MGTDKALLEWQGRPLWLVQLDKLRCLQPERLWIACRREQGLDNGDLAGQDVAWLFDPPGEDLGPIAAIARALEQTDLPLLVLAVDTPMMSADFLRQHLLARAESGRGFFFAADLGVEPLAGIYGPAMRALLTQALERRKLALQSVTKAAADQGLAIIERLPADFSTVFANANTPEEWALLQTQARE